MNLFDRKWFRRYLLAVAGAALLAVGITLALKKGPPPAPVPEAPTADLKFSDFLIEDPFLPEEPDWQLLRPPREGWEREEIMKFWVDPVELGIQKLGGENDQLVSDFFEGIP